FIPVNQSLIKTPSMKKIYILLYFLGQFLYSQAQPLQPPIYDCYQQDAALFSNTQPWVQQFEKLKFEIKQQVTALIQSEQVYLAQEKPHYRDLRSVVNIATTLNRLDSVYDQFFVQAATAIQMEYGPQSACSADRSAANEQQFLIDYLEERVFQLSTNYASQEFARQLGFKSARVFIDQETDSWLTSNQDLSEPDLQLEQPLQDDYFWCVFNADWDMELTNPESALLHLLESNEGKGKQSKLKEILLFIFDNWRDIEDILNWLNTNVFGDCHAVARASFKETVPLDRNLSPDHRRKISYQVLQRGVMLDGRATKTNLKGVARVYKKKWIGWGRDRMQQVGISYCTLQFDPCNNQPWPLNGSPYIQVPNHRYAKSILQQIHPYALSIRSSAEEFLTFDIHFNSSYLKSIYLFGNRPCYGN
ncbi:MAG: hypothetical protein ACK4Y8_05425, partial [Bacteroidota bacterium]